MVRKMLEEANIPYSEQGSNILEINEALKTASKSGTGKAGFPEFVCVVKDFLLVIEDKANLLDHVKYNEKGLITLEVKDVRDYAMNGALFYGLHLAKTTSYKKIIAFGASGNQKHHKITPIFINERGQWQELPDVETFISFNYNNITEYYVTEILKEETDKEKETSEILREAQQLHEDLRTYGSIKDEDKPLIVSGILLALQEIDKSNFSIDSLIGDEITTDGEKIYTAISKHLQRVNVTPSTKRDKLLSQFRVITDTPRINEVNETLGKTPLKHYTEFIYKSIYKSLRFTKSTEDYLGRFYSEFMSYSGGYGQSLGIVLTPKHITELFCDLVDLKPNDLVFDPCCGTAGFLIAAMHKMLIKTND